MKIMTRDIINKNIRGLLVLISVKLCVFKEYELKRNYYFGRIRYSDRFRINLIERKLENAIFISMQFMV